MEFEMDLQKTETIGDARLQSDLDRRAQRLAEDEEFDLQKAEFESIEYARLMTAPTPGDIQEAFTWFHTDGATQTSNLLTAPRDRTELLGSLYIGMLHNSFVKMAEARATLKLDQLENEAHLAGRNK
jgi:hypothetical protein